MPRGKNGGESTKVDQDRVLPRWSPWLDQRWLCYCKLRSNQTTSQGSLQLPGRWSRVRILHCYALLEEVVGSKQLLFGKTNWIRSNVKFVKERLVQSGDTETITTRFISKRCNKQRCGWMWLAWEMRAGPVGLRVQWRRLREVPPCSFTAKPPATRPVFNLSFFYFLLSLSENGGQSQKVE